MPQKVYAKTNAKEYCVKYKKRPLTKAEEDYAKHEDMKYTTHRPDLYEGTLTLEHELFDMLYCGKRPDESQEDFMDELADNIRPSVDCLIQHRKLQRNPAKLMSETECVEHFLAKGIARLAKKPEYTVKTAQEACAPLKAKLRMRGYWDPAAAQVDYSGVDKQKEDVRMLTRKLEQAKNYR